MLPLAVLAATVTPQSASAAEVIAPFNNVTLVANPRPWAISGFPNTINGSVAGGDFARIFTGQAAATGVVIDYGFSTPKFQVTGVQLFNNGGGNLNDADGIGTALVEVFDASNTVVFSGPLTAGNGAGGFRTNFPTPLDNVARVRLSNITNLSPAPGAAPDIIWREFRALQNVATPRITTALGSDGYSDIVTIAGTEGLAGTLTWTLYGPVGAGPTGTCTGVSWTGAPVFDSGTVAVTGDGEIVTTPSTPTADGCYSYGDVLSGPYYRANAVSAVGQAAETFAWPVAPTVTTAINADGYSDDITIRGTNGFGGTIAWTLFGPVNPGPGGTCADAGYTSAPATASGSLTVIGDVTVTATPPADPSAPGCYTYEVTLTGPNISPPVTTQRGEPAESFTRASTPSISTAINPDGFSDDIVVADTSGFAGTSTWTLFGPVGNGPSGTCSDSTWVSAPIFASGALAVAGDGTVTATPATPADEGCYSYAVGQPTETFSVPLAPPVTTTTTTTTTIVPSPTTDPCAATTTTTTTSSTTTSSTTTTSSEPESSAPALAPTPVVPESSAFAAATTSLSPTTTPDSPSTSAAAPESSGPVGFGRPAMQVPDPCAPPTTVSPTTVAPTTPAVTSGVPAAGRGAATGAAASGALPRTGRQPLGPLAVAALVIVLAGAALVSPEFDGVRVCGAVL